MGRKATNVVKDVARPVTAAATGDFKSAGRALWHGAIAAPTTLFKVGQQISEGEMPDVEKARDVGLRQADNLVTEGYDAVVRAIKAAIRPIVRNFMHGAEELLGADDPALEAQAKDSVKMQATAAALPIAASAGAAAGSAIPGLGTAAGAGIASTVTPGLVSQLVDEMWDSGKSRLSSATGSAGAGAGAPAAGAGAPTRTGSGLLILGLGAVALYALTRKR
jgi:hypothetical protein